MKYALYPGCALHGTSRDYGASMLASCRALDIELTEIPGWTCCGATSAHVTSGLLAAALPAVNLVRAERMGLDIILPCAACYNRLAVARERVRTDAKLRAAVEEAIGAPVTGVSRAIHPLNAFPLDQVRARVRRPFTGLRAVTYYGCLLTRPGEISVDENTVNPTVMDHLMRACGVEIADWPFKTECCGATHTMAKPATALRLLERLLTAAEAAGADCIITACPLCQSNLDIHQEKVEHSLGRLLGIPVMFFTELLALALGAPARSLELNRHIVRASGVASAC